MPHYGGGIRYLQDNDRIRETDEGILFLAEQFYSKLYTKPSHTSDPTKFIQDAKLPKLGEEEQELLEKDITMIEIKIALDGMKNYKSPGPDGFTVEFYKTFWDIVGEVVLDSLLCSIQKNSFYKGQNDGIIKLLPKKNKDPSLIQNYRPITLMNVDYKLLSSVMAKRLCNVLNSIIHTDQTGFVRGRYIGDNIKDLYTILDYVAVGNVEITHDSYALFQLDVRKAFDTTDWQFVSNTLRSFGFPDNFISMFNTLYNSKQIRIRNNNYNSLPIQPTTGLAQGCGLSPAIFLLVVEVLASKNKK